MELVLLVWIGIATIWTFTMMGYDKSQARKKGQRVPEKTLWTAALLGGGIGAYLGMMYFRHKTKHVQFRIGFFVLALLTVAVVLWLMDFSLPGTKEF
ncbi:DUF1294 domain-containing protein [Chungangia koreensis]|uniref:DUF1294 domain-containing protein n=1 Tax=Chungangia koreensis TaxID=752657 RepID=A0ABV8X243_9LACT